ncbi:hypothetical protein [Helicobacter suis]|uniref:hypothetical protein n=1 Tax=Helicobacter suis TaxID=104628 RepID=UPI001966EA45|nr:hypothetical protein [Helicobacter suis]
MSRGEFGAVVGTPRLLKLFKKYNIATTWCIPGHTLDTFSDVFDILPMAKARGLTGSSRLARWRVL